MAMRTKRDDAQSRNYYLSWWSKVNKLTYVAQKNLMYINLLKKSYDINEVIFLCDFLRLDVHEHEVPLPEAEAEEEAIFCCLMQNQKI